MSTLLNELAIGLHTESARLKAINTFNRHFPHSAGLEGMERSEFGIVGMGR